MSRFVQLPYIIGKTQKPIFHLDFNSATIADVSGKGHPVTNNGVTIVERDGRKAGNFSAGYLMLDRTMFATLWNTGIFSLEFYLMITDVSQNKVLFGSCRATDKNAPGTLCYGAQTIRFVNNVNWDNMLNVQVLEASKWYHIKIIVDNFKFKFYIDNKEVSAGTIANSFAAWPLYIGAQTASGGSGVAQNNFGGMVSNFKIYDVAL